MNRPCWHKWLCRHGEGAVMSGCGPHVCGDCGLLFKDREEFWFLALVSSSDEARQGGEN